MLSKKFTVLLTIFGLIFIFSLTAAAQIKTEEVRSSGVVPVWLPSGAVQILDESVPAEIPQMLEKIAADSSGQEKLKLYGTEVLIWKGADYKKTGAEIIIRRLTERIKIAKWRYEPGKTESGMTVFKVTEDETGKTVIGFYLIRNEGLLLAWSQVYSDAGGQNQSKADEAAEKQNIHGASDIIQGETK